MRDKDQKRQRVNTSSKTPILFVEDELVILDTISEVLSDLGYQVFRAANGIDACALFDQNEQVIELAIIDYTLPKRSGVDVIHHIQSRRSDVKIILCSGCNQSEIHSNLFDDHSVHFLVKPYEIAKIVDMIEDCLNKKYPPNS